MRRRKFIKNATGSLLGLGGLAGLYAWQIEPFWLEFVEREMPILHLPDRLVGKSLMQISDIHVGNRFDYNYLIDSFKAAQKYEPDFVVYTGDYVSYESPEQFGQLQKVLASAVHGRLATVAILGNHDYGKNWTEQAVATMITNQLQSAGIEVLVNQQLEFEGLNFLGIDDYWGPNFEPEKVMKYYDPAQANIVLCHNPDVCDLDVWNGYKGWILSGHTHGGQCKPPFLTPPLLPVKNKEFTSGEIDLGDGRKLYINRALGHLWQVRFNVRPEITLFHLKRA